MVHASTAEDKSGASYYGRSTGALLDVDPMSGVDATIAGPVHALEWSPTSDVFMSVTGTMPKTSVQLNDRKCNVIKDLGVKVSESDV